jgi:hypothetical protein
MAVCGRPLDIAASAMRRSGELVSGLFRFVFSHPATASNDTVTASHLIFLLLSATAIA